MKVHGKIINEVVKVKIFTKIKMFIKGNGKMIKCMGKERCNL